MELRVGRLPVVTGDPVGLRQLFTNLIENAVRHGGRPDLVVVVDGHERPDGGVELSVRDNGQASRPSTAVRIFLPAAVDARWPAQELTAGAAR